MIAVAVTPAVAVACNSERGSTSPAPVEPSRDRPGENDGRAGTPADQSRTGSSPDDAASGEKAPQYVPSDINHVLSTGQSNAIGLRAEPVLSTAQPFGNLSFDVGVMTNSACDPEGCRVYEKPTGFVPLVEGDRYDDGPVETMSSGLANLASRLAEGRRSGARHDVLVSVHGKSGWVYECLRKASCTFRTELGYLGAFEEGMQQVDDALALARAAGRSYAVRAVTAVHGESDHYTRAMPLASTSGSPGAIHTYADALVEWQRDYDSSIRARTGQAHGVPLLVSQMANWNDREASDIPVWQLEAHVRARGKVVLVAPTYMLDYGSDCIHFTSAGQRRLGEYFAKAYVRVVLDGVPWEPLRPIDAKLDGDTVTVRFAVPRPPLVLDTQAVADPGGLGFELVDASVAPPAVTGVELVSTDTLRVRLSGAPSGSAKHLRYALNATPGTCPGPRTGPRGNVRDSDDTASSDGSALPNWSVAFDIALE